MCLYMCTVFVTTYMYIYAHRALLVSTQFVTNFNMSIAVILTYYITIRFNSLLISK